MSPNSTARAIASASRAGYWALAVFGVLALVLLRGVTDPDIWTHLTVGRETLRLGQVPPTEFYVAPLTGQPGHFNEWGFGVLLFLTERAGGLPALALLNAALGAVTFTLLFDILRQRLDDNRPLALALTLPVVWMAEFRFNFRPEMLTYLAMFATLWGLERYRRTHHWRDLTPMLAAGLLLPQFHPSILLSLIVAGACSLEYLARAETRRHFFAIAGAASLTAGLACINPYGIEQVILPIKFALDAPLMSGITELLPALDTEVGGRFLAAAALALAGMALSRRRTRLADVLLLLFFGWLAYRHARNVALFSMLAVLPVAGGLAVLGWPWLRRRAAPLAAIAVLAVGGHALAQPKWGVGIGEGGTPTGAGALLSKQQLDGPVLAFFHLGNYIAWTQYPRAQVISDARHFGFNEALRMHDQLFSAHPGWERELRMAGISAVVTPMSMPLSGDFVPLAVALLQSPDWTLVLREPAGLTFLPSHRHHGPALPAAEGWRQAVVELQANLDEYPDSAATRANLALARAQLQSSR